MTTKTEFLRAYRDELITRYEWARADPAKLQRFMEAVARTIVLGRGPALWNPDGAAAHAAWTKIGMTNKFSLVRLRHLPAE